MNETNQAILLLTVRFSASKPNEVAPLGSAEYGRLAAWLHKMSHEPRDLLRHPEKILADWSDAKGKITPERVQALLNRGMAMAVALEKWQGAGLWIVTRADDEYPQRLTKQLGQDRPAVLFGAGNKSLLNAGGLAMIGSRDITQDDQAYTAKIAKRAANEGMNIVSGCAKGVDEIAMRSALEVEGTALGILADSLLKKALSGKWRTYIKEGQLCLVSSFSPDAGWNTGNAMGRNKYIYCFSDYALVVQSTKGKGGTWAGATENLTKKWVSLFVQDDSSSPGLEALVKLGAARLSARSDVTPASEWLRNALEAAKHQDLDDTPAPQADPFYTLFLEQLKGVLSQSGSVSLSDLEDRFPSLTRKQITDWLDRAEAGHHLESQGKKRIYSLKEHTTAQLRLILDD